MEPQRVLLPCTHLFTITIPDVSIREGYSGKQTYLNTIDSAAQSPVAFLTYIPNAHTRSVFYAEHSCFFLTRQKLASSCPAFSDSTFFFMYSCSSEVISTETVSNHIYQCRPCIHANNMSSSANEDKSTVNSVSWLCARVCRIFLCFLVCLCLYLFRWLFLPKLPRTFPITVLFCCVVCVCTCILLRMYVLFCR